MALLSQQVNQKEGKYFKGRPPSQTSHSQINGFVPPSGPEQNGNYQLSNVTTKQLAIEREVVELNSLNQELERRLKGVQENFRQARDHHDQELQVQRQNYDRVEVSARENAALAQQYMAQVQELRANVEQLNNHSTNLQQGVIQVQGQLQAKD